MSKVFVSICASVALLFLVVSCGGNKVDVKPEVKRPKKERPLNQMMMHRPIGDQIDFEDDWFTYELKLERVVKGMNANINSVGGACRYQGATYTVIDKETNSVVRVRHIDSSPCSNCHMR